MDDAQPIDDFMSHIDAMRSLVAFVAMLPSTLPHVMKLLSDTQRRKIDEPCVKQWIAFNRQLYGDPTLYRDPPVSMPVDPNCPPLQLSDHIRDRLGKCHPFFDFVHAPFTHPLGTQISLVCINYCWDAYDTFIKQTISLILARHPDHPNSRAYREQLTRHKADGTSFPTDSQLATLAISVTDSYLQEFLEYAEPSWTPMHAKRILTVAKALRSVFTHHFGKPNNKLRRLMQEHQLEAIRIIDDRLEVLTPLIRDVATVVQGQALIVNRRRGETYV
jgi:hypothetical protein